MLKQNILFIIIILICCYSSSMLANCPTNSGPTVPCDPCEKYPYRVCVYDAEQDKMIQKTVCTDRPDTLHRIGIPIKVELPICIKTNTDFFFTTIIGNGTPARLLDIDNIHSDIAVAANKWNCICGYHSDLGGCGTTIPAAFTRDWWRFKDPYNEPSSYNKVDECDPYSGTIYFNATNEFAYATASFDNKEILPPDNAFSHFIVNEHWITDIDNYPRILNSLENKLTWPRDAKIYNLVDIAIQSIGSVLGMGYSKDCGCDENSIMHPDGIWQVNDPNPLIIVEGKYFGTILPESTMFTGRINDQITFFGKIINGIVIGTTTDGKIVVGTITPPPPMSSGTFTGKIHNPPAPYRGLGGANNDPSGDCDKCMFKTLYCNDNPCPVSVYNYQQRHTNLFPNPSHNFVAIEFELATYSENVTIKIMDGLGRILLTPIENKTYDSGVHTEQINVKGFENGYYYMLIQTPNKSFVQPFIVIK